MYLTYLDCQVQTGKRVPLLPTSLLVDASHGDGLLRFYYAIDELLDICANSSPDCCFNGPPIFRKTMS